MAILLPAAVPVEVVGVFPYFLGKFVIVSFRGGDEPPLAVLGPGEEVVVAQVFLRGSRRGAFGSEGPLTGSDQHGAPFGGHCRNARVHDELDRPAIFKQVRPVLPLSLGGEGAAGGFHNDLGVAGHPHDEASDPESEPVRTISFHVVQLGSFVHPGSDSAREAQFDLAGFARPDAVSGKEGTAPLGLVSAEVVSPLMPDVAVDDAEIPVGVGTSGFLVGLREGRRGLAQTKQQAQGACVPEDLVAPVRSFVHGPPPGRLASKVSQSLCQTMAESAPEPVGTPFRLIRTGLTVCRDTGAGPSTEAVQEFRRLDACPGRLELAPGRPDIAVAVHELRELAPVGVILEKGFETRPHLACRK